MSTVNFIPSVVIFHICQNKITIPEVESTVDIHRKILLAKHVDQSQHEGEKAAEWVEDLKANKD